MSNTERDAYIADYKKKATNTITEEHLPFVSDIMDFALKGKTDSRLQRVFDFFGDEEDIKEQTSRKNMFLTSEQSQKFIDSVIAANITDISQSGTLYKMLQASGDTYRIRSKNCESKGRKIELPIDEISFEYEIKNCNVYFDDPSYLMMFEDFSEFKKASAGEEFVYVRSPMTCKKLKQHGCCEVCAGKLPDGAQNIGAFSTLMITEFATQAALSSMNKGKKQNVNTILTSSGAGINTLKKYFEWTSEILEDLRGADVQRRFYEIALLGRLHIEKGGKIRVSSLANPNSENYFGEFIYRPKEKTFKKMIEAGSFFDDSLKTQIAFNNYKRGLM